MHIEENKIKIHLVILDKNELRAVLPGKNEFWVYTKFIALRVIWN